MASKYLLDSARIGWHEIEYPEYASPRLVGVMARIRAETESPIYYTSSGEMPHGKRHSRFSLHKMYVDHEESYVQSRLVLSQDGFYKAFDVYCPWLPLSEFYLIAEKFVPGGGIGVYPYWNNPGLHIDVRGTSHPAYGARWWRDREGNYHYDPTWHTLNTIFSEATWGGLEKSD